MNRTILAVALTLGAAGGLAGCHSRRTSDVRETTPDRPRRVTLATVMRSGADGVEYVPAAVAAPQRATLGARIAAAVVALPFQEGERVTRGAVVVRLDDAALRSAESAAEIASKVADADLARMEALLVKGVVAPREHDGARARAAGARAALTGVRDDLSYAVLRAPFDGVVATRPVHVGDVVAPGAPLLEIEGAGGLEIRATVRATLVASMRPGEKVTCRVDGQAAAVTAIVRSISPAADPATHRVELRADLAPAPGLRSGLFARVAIPRPDSAARLTVPAGAIVLRGGLSGIFVVSDGSARLRWVAAGESRDGATELRAGAEAGERLVLDPSGLVDGVRVEAAP
jgi:RND family efflux transporter MFP subunit